MSGKIHDIAIIGGGVNGCGIARDAAGRGLSVILAEMNDLASGTSSASTKLIHGGLRYLEHYEFRLVREALREREVLLRAAPHIIAPMRFVLPHHPGLRPAWLIRLGLFLYDHLGGRELLPGSRALDLTRDEAGGPLKPAFARGFEYSDCTVDDARLVVLAAMDAHERGADIRVRTRMTKAHCAGGLWHVTLEDAFSGRRETIRARALVNASGPWAGETARHSQCASGPKGHVRLVKGSHIVVPRLYDHDRAYILQNADKRIVFTIPYLDKYTLIGTTDVDVPGKPGPVEASDEEIAYLCEAVDAYFEKPVVPHDVVWSFAGIRPLYDDGSASAQAVTRDYVLDLQVDEAGKAPMLTVFGGKLTGFRELAEDVLHKLAGHFPAMGGDWTRNAPLPGGDFAPEGFADLLADFRARHPSIAEDTARRICHAYGTRAADIFSGMDEDAGEDFGAGLTEREAAYLVESEWARTANDILWRRSKLGLEMPPEGAGKLRAWLAARGLGKPSNAQSRG